MLTTKMEVLVKKKCVSLRQIMPTLKNFEIKYLGEYQDLYILSNTLLLAHVFVICFFKYMNMILKNFLQLLDQHGKQLQKRLK